MQAPLNRALLTDGTSPEAPRARARLSAAMGDFTKLASDLEQELIEIGDAAAARFARVANTTVRGIHKRSQIQLKGIVP